MPWSNHKPRQTLDCPVWLLGRPMPVRPSKALKYAGPELSVFQKQPRTCCFTPLGEMSGMSRLWATGGQRGAEAVQSCSAAQPSNV